MGRRHVLIPLAVAMAASAWLVLQDPPIWGDRAYFLVHAQLIADGRPLYASTIFGYTPYGPLVGAVFAKLMMPLGVPFLLTQRIAGIALYLCVTGLIVLAAWRLAGKARFAMLAGLAWVGMAHPLVVSVVDVEPKMIVAAASVSWLLALEAGWVFGAGAAAGVAAMSWQPGGILLLATPFAMRWAGVEWRPNAARLLVGCLLGCLPALAYVLVFDDWNEMSSQVITRHAVEEAQSLFAEPLTWPARAGYYAVEDLPILLASLIGFVHVIRDPAAGPLAGRGRPLLVAVVAWALFNSVQFEGLLDLVPMLPLLAILAAVTLSEVVSSPTTHPTSAAIALWTVIALLLFSDLAPPRYPATAEQQRVVMTGISDLAGPENSVVAFNVDEFYALTGRSPPVRFLRLAEYSYDEMERHLIGGRMEFARTVRDMRPSIILVRPVRSPRVNDFMEEEVTRGYTRFDVPEYGWQDSHVWTTRIFPRNGFFYRPLHVYVDPHWVTPELVRHIADTRALFDPDSG